MSVKLFIIALLLTGCCFSDTMPCKVMIVDKTIQQNFMGRNYIITFNNLLNHEKTEMVYSEFVYNNVSVGDTLNAECECSKPMAVQLILKRNNYEK